MISFSEIMNAVQELVRERFPDAAYYQDKVPALFARPSFLVELGPVEVADASLSCMDVSITVVVTAFVEADDFHNSHVPDLVRRMAAVQELFAVEGLRIEDRVLHVAANKGNCQFDYAEAAITFRYQDDRPGGRDWPLMGEIKTNIEEG